MTTLADLLTAKTSDEILADLIAALNGRGLPTTDWSDVGPERALLELWALQQADESTAIPLIAAGMLLELASGAWLTLLASSRYEITRNPATRTTRTIVLANASGSAYTLTAGQMTIRGTVTGNLYQSTTGGVLAAAGTLSITVAAEAAGASYADTAGDVSDILTPLPGVTVSSDTLLVSGTDEETDDALRIRCHGRWPSLNAAAPTLSAYDLLARQGSTSVTRTKVKTSATVNGVLTIYLAGSSGAVAGGVVTAVQAYVDARTPATSYPTVASASNQAITLAGTATVTAGYATAAKAALNTGAASVLAYIQSVAIEGTIRLAQLIEILMGPAGMVDIAGLTINGVAANYVLASTKVATWGQDISTALTWVEV